MRYFRCVDVDINDNDMYGENKSLGPRFVEMSNAEVLVAVRKDNALVVTTKHVPKDWLLDQEWHSTQALP